MSFNIWSLYRSFRHISCNKLVKVQQTNYFRATFDSIQAIANHRVVSWILLPWIFSTFTILFTVWLNWYDLSPAWVDCSPLIAWASTKLVHVWYIAVVGIPRCIFFCHIRTIDQSGLSTNQDYRPISLGNKKLFFGDGAHHIFNDGFRCGQLNIITIKNYMIFVDGHLLSHAFII
jgi:hypothetical protein